MHRDNQIDTFLAANNLQDAERHPLNQDASYRRYFRLELGGKSLLLMDAPPELEKPEAFAQTTTHLESLGARVPRILSSNLDQGLLLIEDLGDQTFTRLLRDNADERTLYRSAIEELAGIQNHFSAQAGSMDLPPYDLDATLAEARLFTEWYLPEQLTRPLTREESAEYEAIWEQLFNQREQWRSVLVHRDYHVDNLVMVDGRCAMLDYQDALLGSPLYDLVSLVEDARRDIAPPIRQDMISCWCDLTDTDQATIADEYRFWAVQRHCKVAGIFLRLAKRDGKTVYLKHVDRVVGLLQTHLESNQMQSLNSFLRSLNVVPSVSPPIE